MHNHSCSCSTHNHAAGGAYVLPEDLLKDGSEDSPYYPFALAAIRASARCRDVVKPWIDVKGQQMRLQQEVYVFAEFLFFFAHMTERRLYGRIGEEQLKELLEYLTPALFRASALAYFTGWPEEQMEKIADEFVERLNDAHLKYSQLDEKGDIVQALLTLTRLVVEQAGVGQSTTKGEIEDRASTIAQTVANELMGMNLDALLEQIQQKQG